MRRILLVVLVGVGFAGCAAQSSRWDQGYAMPGDLRTIQDKQANDLERSQAWSARDFAHPRGLVW